ncbi:MAG: hypothetical protein IPK60_21400 [Sandaracinaceae bacterium]|nr:hypothetical protein [Sandaracinaceae bacterium]
MRSVISSLLILVTAVGCGSQSSEPDESTDGGALQAGPGAFTEDFRINPDFATRMAAPVVGTSPHGEVQIWYSTNIESVLGDATITVLRGTVSIKTSNGDGVAGVDALAVMIKQAPGYDPDNGDWLYEMRTPDGVVMNDPESGMPMSGRIPMCIQCHRGYQETDYLAGTSLR